ncbi:MAG: cell division protein ZapB [Pseudomonadota bacterium]|nr:cell division protein ZapB [Pseudomonadota bacterium]
MDSDNLAKLEERINELIDTCRRLNRENHTLRSDRKNLENEHGSLASEHSRLVEKTQIARARIEAMIGRLKALERS